MGEERAVTRGLQVRRIHTHTNFIIILSIKGKKVNTLPIQCLTSSNYETILISLSLSLSLLPQPKKLLFYIYFTLNEQFFSFHVHPLFDSSSLSFFYKKMCRRRLCVCVCLRRACGFKIDGWEEYEIVPMDFYYYYHHFFSPSCLTNETKQYIKFLLWFFTFFPFSIDFIRTDFMQDLFIISFHEQKKI